nr:hypothetical protein [Salinarchaeum sp. Harcht-Bsk1]
MAHPVVGVALDRIPERVVGLLHRRKLGVGAGIVVVVGVVLPDLLAERGLDLVL